MDNELFEGFEARLKREDEARAQVRRAVAAVALVFVLAVAAYFVLRPGTVRVKSVTFTGRSGLVTVEAGRSLRLSPVDPLKVVGVETEPRLFLGPKVYVAQNGRHDLKKGIAKVGTLWPKDPFLKPKSLEVLVARGDSILGRVTVTVDLSPLFWVEKGYRADTYKKGILYLERALALSPENPIIAYRLALRYNIVGRFKEASSLLEKFLPHNPSIPFVKLKIEAQEGLGKPEEVAAAYRQLLSLDQSAEEEANRFGSYLASNLGIDAAIERLKEEMKALPEGSSRLLLAPLANLYARKSWFESATDTYHKALAQGLKSPLIYYNLSNIYSHRKNPKLAGQYMDLYLGKRPSDADALLAKARMEVDRGNYNKAIELLEKSLEHKKDNLKARLLLAELYDKTKQKDKARVQYEAIVKLAPKSHTAHFNLGTYYLEKGQYKRARSSFGEAESLKPGVRESLEGLVAANEGLKDWGPAIRPLAKLWNLKPNNRDLKKIFIYHDKLKDYAAMEKTLTSLLNKAPKNPRLREYLAYAHIKQGKLKKAREQYKKAMKLDPKNKDYLFKAARVEVKQGNIDSALAIYKKILEIEPDNEKAAKMYLELSRKKILR